MVALELQIIFDVTKYFFIYFYFFLFHVSDPACFLSCYKCNKFPLDSKDIALYICLKFNNQNNDTMKTTIERKYQTTLEMLSKLERIMLLDELNSLPFGTEFDEKVAMRKKVTDVLNYLSENK